MGGEVLGLKRDQAKGIPKSIEGKIYLDIGEGGESVTNDVGDNEEGAPKKESKGGSGRKKEAEVPVVVDDGGLEELDAEVVRRQGEEKNVIQDEDTKSVDIVGELVA